MLSTNHSIRPQPIFCHFFYSKNRLNFLFFYKYVPPMYRLKEVIGHRWLKIIQTFFGNSCPT